MFALGLFHHVEPHRSPAASFSSSCCCRSQRHPIRHNTQNNQIITLAKTVKNNCPTETLYLFARGFRLTSRLCLSLCTSCCICGIKGNLVHFTLRLLCCPFSKRWQVTLWNLVHKVFHLFSNLSLYYNPLVTACLPAHNVSADEWHSHKRIKP